MIPGEASAFFHGREPGLHHSPDIEHVIEYLQQNGEHIPNHPASKIVRYFGFLSDPEYVNDGLMTGDQESIDYQIEHSIVGRGEISESYFELQRRIARDELGLGDINITPRVRAQMTEMVREDQRSCLQEWVAYLNSEDNDYPAWFKHYAFSAITKLTEYEPGKEKFRRRSNGTAANFPELNQEVLALVYESIDKRHIEGDAAPYPDQQTERLVQSGNFAKLYTHFFNESRPSAQELETLEGEWRRFESTDDETVVRKLTDSLKGKGTGWCTAGEATAAKQLLSGDFYVYYTRDSSGEYTNPRIAIRMEGYHVAEVRGIEKGQNMEACVYGIVDEKLSELPGGNKWKRVAKSMQHLNAIYESVEQGKDLDAHDLLFLREYGGKIENFGYLSDPRIAQLLRGRSAKDDLRIVINHFGSENISQKLIENKYFGLLASNLDLFDHGTVDIQALIQGLDDMTIIEIIDKLPVEAIDQTSLIERILKSRKTDHIDALLRNHARFNEGAFDFASITQRLLKFEGAEWLLIKHADILPGVEQIYEQLLDKLFASRNDSGYFNTDSNSPLRRRVHNSLDYVSSEEIQSYWAKAIAASPYPLAIARQFVNNKESGMINNLVIHAKDFIKAIGRDDYAKWLVVNKLEIQAAKCLERLDGSIDQDQLANTLLSRGELEVLADNLEKFKDGVIDHADLTERLLLTQKGGVVIVRNLNKFKPGIINPLDLYHQLIREKQGNTICEHINQFTATVADVKKIVADLADNGMIECVGANFTYIARQYGLEEFGTFLAHNGGSVLLRSRKSAFKGLLKDDEVVEGLIRDGRADLVLKSFDSFDLTRYTARDVIIETIKCGHMDKLSSKFVWLVDVIPIPELKEILLSEPGGELVIMRHIADFDLDQETCNRVVGQLCSQGKVNEVGKRISYIMSLADHKYLAKALIDNGGAAIVARHFNNFSDGSVDTETLFQSLVSEKEYDLLQEAFGKNAVDQLDPNHYISHLMSRRKITKALVYMASAEQGAVDKQAVFDRLLSLGRENAIFTHPEIFMSFDGSIDKARLADVLLRNGRVLEVAENIRALGTENVDTELLVNSLLDDNELGALLKCLGILPKGSLDPLRIVRIWSLLGSTEISERQLSILLRSGGAINVADSLIKTGVAYFIEDHLDTFLKHASPEEMAEFLEEVGFGYMVHNHPVLSEVRQKVESF